MRVAEVHKQASDLFWRIVPISAVVAFISYVIGTQVVSPHHRTMKALVVALMAVIMLRFDMIFTLYLFVILFPVPSGVAITSTNVALMSLIFLLWVVRANARKVQILPKTPIDVFIGLFLMAYVVSFFSVNTVEGILQGLLIVWRQLTALAFFYLIVRFVDDPQKLDRFTKFIGCSAAFLAFTAVVEFFSPGATIIPGWIELKKQIGEGTLGYRLEGLRLGGAVGSHGLLSDYCTLALFFMTLHFVRVRNAVPKLFWLLVTIMTFGVLMATANRGAFLALTIGVTYSMWVFRSYMNPVRYVILLTSFALLFGLTQLWISQQEYAVSVIDRLMHTHMIGVVPDSREGLYGPILERCKEHIFIGHGPHYRLGLGLKKLFWPHNGYIYFLFTLGLFGLTSFLLICYRLFRMSSIYKRPFIHGTTEGMIMSVLHVQLVVFLLAQLRTDHQRDHDYVYIYIVWMLFGLIVAAYNIIRKREAAEEMAVD